MDLDRRVTWAGSSTAFRRLMFNVGGAGGREGRRIARRAVFGIISASILKCPSAKSTVIPLLRKALDETWQI